MRINTREVNVPKRREKRERRGKREREKVREEEREGRGKEGEGRRREKRREKRNSLSILTRTAIAFIFLVLILIVRYLAFGYLETIFRQRAGWFGLQRHTLRHRITNTHTYTPDMEFIFKQKQSPNRK